MDSHGPNRMLAIGLALAAAACLLFAGVSKQWLVNNSDYSHIGVGLRAAEMTEADGNGGMSMSLSELTRGETAPVWLACGTATFVECLAGAAALVVAAGLALGKKRPDLPIMPTTIALLAMVFGLVTGPVFIASKPGEAGALGASLGFFVFGAGAVLGMASAMMLAKVNRPLDPESSGAMNPDDF